jgi:hypothetical protein
MKGKKKVPGQIRCLFDPTDFDFYSINFSGAVIDKKSEIFFTQLIISEFSCCRIDINRQSYLSLIGQNRDGD